MGTDGYSHGWVLTRRIRPRSGGTDNPLSSYLAEHLDFLGSASKFPPPFPADKKDKSGGEGHVPFLFKVLTG